MSTRRFRFASQRSGIPVLLLGLLPAIALGQANYTPYTFTSLAGAASPGSADGARSRARFSGPGGVVVDATGTLYVADTGNSTIRKITPDGVVTTVAGLAGSIGGSDGTGTGARFDHPASLAVGAAGSIYVADTANHTIRRITSGGVVSTLAGMAGVFGSTDGTGSTARFNHPQGLAVDTSGYVYVADTGNYTVRKVAPDGTVTTLAGLTGTYGDTDGTGSAARFRSPVGLTIDQSNNVYVGDEHTGGIGAIRKLTPGGAVTTLALVGAFPRGISVDSAGNVFVVLTDYCEIEELTPQGSVLWLAGNLGGPGNVDGTGYDAHFRYPRGIAVDSAGTVYVADTQNNTIRKGVPPDASANVLWAAGNNEDGELGDGSTTNRASPVAIRAGIRAVAAGQGHSLLVTDDGTVWSTGDNAYGQLGDGTTITRNVYAHVSGFGMAVAAGASHSLLLRYDGSLWATGRNNYGQLGDGTTTDRASPVLINRTSDPYFSVQAVAAGADHSLFLASDGTLWGMGYNGYGQLGVAAGSLVSTPVRIASGVRAMAAGGEHSLFVKDDGTLWGMGYNRLGQLGDGTAADRATPVPVAADVWMVAAGYHYSLFVKTDGTLWGMGESASGELGGMYGDVVTPVQIASGVRALSAGQSHSLFVKTDATLWAMGDNHDGQLGDTTTVARITPVQIADHVRRIAAGSHYSLFVVDSSLDGSLPVITAPPRDQIATAGQYAFFSVAFDSTSPASCRWQRRARGSATWVDLSDDATFRDTASPAVRNSTSASIDGDSYRCMITNSNGMVITGSATLALMAGTPLTVTTLAGRPNIRGSADGTGSAARFAAPADLAVDGAGNAYVADTENHTIRKVTSGGVVTALAGLAGLSGSSDGTGSSARFNRPAGVAADSAGNVFVADTDNNTIRKVSSAGVVTTLAGQAGSAGSADGPSAMARFNGPSGMVVDASGNLYVADTLNNAIRRITPAGTVATVYPPFEITSGPWLSGPQGLALDGAGNLYIADANSSRIQKLVLATATLTVAAGSGSIGSDDGPASLARFAYPSGVAVDGAGNLYIADTDNHTIRQLTPAGTVSTIAGLASASGAADGVGAAARFTYPTGIAVDASGNI